MAGTATSEHTQRLLAAMAATIDEKGYAATTIADVVARARVSKRTFYEHFADKEAAFLATYSSLSDEMLGVIAAAAGGEDVAWDERVAAGVHAYLTQLALHPTLTRTFLAEIQAAGPRALALRREVIGRFAAGLQAIVAEVASTDPTVHPLDEATATATVGGINELLLRAVEAGDAEDLAALSGTAADFIRRVVATR